MVDPRTAKLWGFRALFLGLAVLILFFRLLPLSALPQDWPLPQAIVDHMPGWLYPHDWPGTDMLLALTLVWVQRRPDFVPAPLIAAAFLLDDLLTGRPPGLWTLIVVAGTEFLRSREARSRDLPFVGEWLMAGAVIAAMVLANRLVLTIFMVPQVGFGPVVIHMVATILLYSLLAGLMQLTFGLHRAAPGEVDSWGNRI
ncbi:rod shape-determining protein MreD [Frigidibacter sp. RF13]|uniref:rod shape-determining protein MreD n=1 Tax=Frigidibacter sp. RF13 TaxID=2997340 RepID=UPI002270C5A4|nr:rod shape-determining protein MreD [Frigidibacter sp. RF13]MCY1126399.1 rod shape-determining protein MreD [Frigidibacter sp. RF13]